MDNLPDNPHAYRGYLISVFAELEKTIEFVLLDHFQPQAPTIEMIHIIFDRMTFEAKRTAYKAILDKNCIKAGFEKKKDKPFPHSKLLDKIRQLNEIRVQFAHYLLADDLPNEKYVIALVEMRDGTKAHIYSKEKFGETIKEMKGTMEKISKTNEPNYNPINPQI